MRKFFNCGDIIYGFCNGYFGRDDYDTKMCIHINPRYAVFQYLDGEWEGNGVVLNNPDRLDLEMINKWKEDENNV